MAFPLQSFATHARHICEAAENAYSEGHMAPLENRLEALLRAPPFEVAIGEIRFTSMADPSPASVCRDMQELLYAVGDLSRWHAILDPAVESRDAPSVQDAALHLAITAVFEHAQTLRVIGDAPKTLSRFRRRFADGLSERERDVFERFEAGMQPLCMQAQAAEIMLKHQDEAALIQGIGDTVRTAWHNGMKQQLRDMTRGFHLLQALAEKQGIDVNFSHTDAHRLWEQAALLHVVAEDDEALKHLRRPGGTQAVIDRHVPEYAQQPLYSEEEQRKRAKWSAGFEDKTSLLGRLQEMARENTADRFGGWRGLKRLYHFCLTKLPDEPDGEAQQRVRENRRYLRESGYNGRALNAVIDQITPVLGDIALQAVCLEAVGRAQSREQGRA